MKFNSKREVLLIIVLLFTGFLIRVLLTAFGNFGDVSVFAEWGMRFWEIPLENYYNSGVWYFTKPTYPTLSPLIYAFLYWLYERRYVLAQIHNAIKIVPAAFIIHFGKPVPNDIFGYGYGYYMLIKLPAIIADLGLSVLIGKIIYYLTKNKKFAFYGFCLYLFNPLTIFLSSVWGQVDSLITLIGVLSFLALLNDKVFISLPLYLVSLYIKPNFGVFIPLYIYLLYKIKSNLKQIVLGITISFLILILITRPFSDGNIISFTRWLWIDRVFSTLGVSHKASISAFNIYTIFWQIDKTSDKLSFLGMPLNIYGVTLFVIVYLLTIRHVEKMSVSILSVFEGIFMIGFSAFLMMTNMLERYFFSAFPAVIILIFTNIKFLIWGIVINITTFANVIWAFYRRRYSELDRVFTDNNFLVIRIISAFNTVIFTKLALDISGFWERQYSSIKLKMWKKKTL